MKRRTFLLTIACVPFVKPKKQFNWNALPLIPSKFSSMWDNAIYAVKGELIESPSNLSHEAAMEKVIQTFVEAGFDRKDISIGNPMSLTEQNRLISNHERL